MKNNAYWIRLLLVMLALVCVPFSYADDGVSSATSAGSWSHANVTPGTCATCHNGSTAEGKPRKHVATTASCDLCHSTSRWEPARLNHSNATPGSCAGCHNGSTAEGKDSGHIATTASCDLCHSTSGWKPASVNHSNVTVGTCSSCHNGSTARGKSTLHIATTATCDLCHTTSAWKPATSTATIHANVAAGTCATCHNGSTATGKTATHIATTASCDTCHATTAWKPATGGTAAIHANVAAGSCGACHNGMSATGKSAAHISTTASCDACHTTTAWKPVSTATIHANVGAGSCAACHNGMSATGKIATHIATTDSCDTCHTTSAWKPATGNSAAIHANVVAGTCANCHDGTTATGKTATHVTTTASCDTCHATTGWLPATTAGIHTNVVAGSCASCHNGTTATGKSATHVAVNATCDTCHATTGWVPATATPAAIHSAVIAGTCATCHNGTTATGKTAFHPITDASCDSCHAPTGWLPTTMPTIDFPLEAVMAKLATTASTYTADSVDANGNHFRLTAERVPGADKTETLIYPVALNTFTRKMTLEQNGTVVATQTYETYFQQGPLSLFGNLNNMGGMSNNMKVTVQLQLPTTGKVGASGLVFKGRNYVNNNTASYDTWYAKWALDVDTSTTAWMCIGNDITPADPAAVAASDEECFQIDQNGTILGYKASMSLPQTGMVQKMAGNYTAGGGVPGTTVVEFYNSQLDNYVVTADVNEIAAIEAGAAGAGWARTGQSFASGGNTAVCRFYGSYAPGPNSHFYTADAGECDGLKMQQIPPGDPRKQTDKSWNYEGIAFSTNLPLVVGVNGSCASGTVPIYRAYNNGFTRGVDSNHRLTTSLTAIQDVVARGWTNEGVVMCAPQ